MLQEWSLVGGILQEGNLLALDGGGGASVATRVAANAGAGLVPPVLRGQALAGHHPQP